MGEFDDLIDEFVTESREHIADIEEDLIRIEKDKEDVDAEVINRVFRAAHSIKGSAKFLDLNNIGELAHKMEDVLNLIRSGKLIPTSDVTSPLLLGADMLKLMFEDVTASNDMDISENVVQLQAILTGGSSAKPAKSGSKSKKAAPKIEHFDSVPVDLIKKRIGKGPLYAIQAEAGANPDFIKEIGALGEILGSFESAENVSYILFATIIEPDVLPSVLQIPDGDFLEVNQASLAELAGDSASAKKIQARQVREIPAAEPRRKEEGIKPGMKQQRTSEQYEEEEREPMEEDEIITEKVVIVESRNESEQSEEAAARENASFITFSLDEEIYAVPIYMVEEIIGLQDISLLPNTPEFIRGVINLRGDIVPIMDLRRRFGLEEKEYNPLTVFLIVRVHERVLGMVVDKVSDVLVINPAQIQQTPAFFAKISTEFIQGVYKDPQGQLVILLNVSSLIKPEEWSMRRSHPVAIVS